MSAYSRTRWISPSRSSKTTQIGLPPKHAARLVRFDHTAHRLAAGEVAALATANSGYADQSHLHRDVRAFTGGTPATVVGEWLAVDDIAWIRGDPRAADQSVVSAAGPPSRAAVS